VLNGDLPLPLPLVPGHESAGTVEAVGEGVHYVKPGDPVVTCVSHFCGHCEWCLSGRAYGCTSDQTPRDTQAHPRLSAGGEAIGQFFDVSSFAEQLLVPQNGLVKIPTEMPLDKAALLGCGVITGMGAVFNTAAVTPGSTVAVVGTGGVGLSAIQAARIAGARRIFAVDLVASKLELAKHFGATDGVDASEVDPVQAVVDMTDGGVDFGFEFIGLTQTVRQMFDMTRRAGTATVVGVLPPDATIALTAADLISGKRFQSSLMGGGSFFLEVPRYVDYYLNGTLMLDEMISATLPLEKVMDAFEAMKTGSVARSVILFDA
jgi:S-(hydroxymethyl)glutathione dehydrogenase/alcohol dehydrogenase